MLIKEADSRQSDLDELNALLALPHVNADTKQQIRQEIRNIQSGIKGENRCRIPNQLPLRKQP